MDILENFLQNNNLDDPDDMDSLLECADIVRQLISKKQYDGINTIINYTVDQNYTDGFLWTMNILQEENRFYTILFLLNNSLNLQGYRLHGNKIFVLFWSSSGILFQVILRGFHQKQS